MSDGKNTYLVEYKMLWAGRVVRAGVEETKAYSDYDADRNVREYLSSINRKAAVEITAVVEV